MRVAGIQSWGTRVVKQQDKGLNQGLGDLLSALAYTILPRFSMGFSQLLQMAFQSSKCKRNANWLHKKIGIDNKYKFLSFTANIRLGIKIIRCIS